MELAATDQGCWEVDEAILPSRAEVAATALRISLKKVPRQTTRKSDTEPIQVRYYTPPRVYIRQGEGRMEVEKIRKSRCQGRSALEHLSATRALLG